MKTCKNCAFWHSDNEREGWCDPKSEDLPHVDVMDGPSALCWAVVYTVAKYSCSKWLKS